MRVGDPVLLRSLYRGNVRWCWPHRYVGEWDGRHGIYVQPGSQGKLMKRAVGKSYLDYWVTDAPALDYVWEHTHVLRFMRPGDAHTVEIFWDTEWRHIGWYVNLQDPLVVRGDRTAPGTGRTKTTSSGRSSWASSTRTAPPPCAPRASA